MSRCVVDTNVPVVANGRHRPDEPRPPSIACREAAIKFLIELLKKRTILLDVDGAIQAEYHKHLNPRGQPGVGDRFYRVILQSSLERVERVALSKRSDGEYADLPQSLIDSGFDRSDRKFAALARREGAVVFNATDSDWIEHAAILDEEHIQVEHLCGCDPALWFAA